MKIGKLFCEQNRDYAPLTQITHVEGIFQNMMEMLCNFFRILTLSTIHLEFVLYM